MAAPIPPAVPQMPFRISTCAILSLAPNEIPQSLQQRLTLGQNVMLAIPEVICLNFYLPRIQNALRAMQGEHQQNIVVLGLSEDIQGQFRREISQFDFSRKLQEGEKHLPALVKSIWEKVQTANPDPEMRDLLLQIQSQMNGAGYVFSQRQSQFLSETTQRANEALINNHQQGTSCTPPIKGSDGFVTPVLTTLADAAVTTILYPILDTITQGVANDEVRLKAFKKHSPAGWAVFNTERPQFLAALLEVKDQDMLKKLLDVLKKNNFLASFIEDKYRRFLTILFVKERVQSPEGQASLRQLAAQAAREIR